MLTLNTLHFLGSKRRREQKETNKNCCKEPLSHIHLFQRHLIFLKLRIFCHLFLINYVLVVADTRIDKYSNKYTILYVQ